MNKKPRKALCKNCVHFKVCITYMRMFKDFLMQHWPDAAKRIPEEWKGEPADDCEHFKEGR